MDSNNNIQHSKPVPPFVRYCSAIIPTVFDDSLSYYEALCALWKWMQDNLVDVINNNANVTEEYIRLTNELKEYVENYFANLDVQEEINNKLDAMVTDGTFQQIVDAYLEQLTHKVKYIFPNNWAGAIGTNYGDCSIIQGYGKNVMIDTADAAYKTQLYQLMTNNGVTHIDYLMISHFHADHCGNTVNLINDGYLDNTSVIYLPPLCNYLQNLPTMMANRALILQAAQDAGITVVVPAEGSALTIDNELKIYFYNCDADNLDEEDYFDYNNYSMICYVKHGNKRVLYTGDCYKLPLDRLVQEGFIDEKVDLYKVEHHGIEYPDSHTPFELLEVITPDFAFIPASSSQFDAGGSLSESLTTAWLKSIGCKLFTSMNNNTQVSFVSSLDELDNTEGKQILSLSNNFDEIDIYCDATQTELYQDGTQEHPYRDINQAIGTIGSNIKFATIHLADGEYNYTAGGSGDKQRNRFCNMSIFIEGTSKDNVTLNNGIYIHNANIDVRNVTIKANLHECILAYNSNITVLDCAFTTDRETPATYTNGITSNDCHINVVRCTFDKLGIALNTHNDILRVEGCTFSDLTTAIELRNCLFVNTNNTFGENITNKINATVLTTIVGNEKQLFSGNQNTSGDIDLSEDLRNFSKMMVVIGSTTTGTTTSSVYSFASSGFVSNEKFKIPAIDGFISATLSADGTALTVDATDTNMVRKIYAIKEIRG